MHIPKVECVEADRSLLLAGLDIGEIDIAILMGVASHDEFRCEPLWSERMLVALADRRAAPPAMLIVNWQGRNSSRFGRSAAEIGRHQPDLAIYDIID